MPGTILVSVLEFMGLPLSSTSIKVSMGKTEYLISEKREFSFPLTSLREDFTIKLQDADGNEISRIGVHTKSIVEKGVWEDIFALGHGHLRLKLQFILNDEDRDKIRMMRESALKKKHDELLRSSPRGSENDSASVGNDALTFRNDEVSGFDLTLHVKEAMKIKIENNTMRTNSDLNSIVMSDILHFSLSVFPDILSSPSSQESPKRYPQLEAVCRGKSPVGFQTEKKTGPNIVLGAEPDLMQPHPNSAVEYKEISSNKPMSEAFGDLTKLQEKDLTKKPAFGSPFSKDPQRAINSFRSSNSNQNEVAENNLIQPNPSSVRKMISAFEMQSGLSQDMKSPIKSPPREHHSSTNETKASFKTQNSVKEKAWNKGPLSLLQGKSKGSSMVCELLNKQTDSNARNKFKLSHKSDIEEEKCSKDFVRKFASETVTDSGKMPEKISDRYRPSNWQDSRSNPNKEVKRENGFKLNSGVHSDNNYCPFECSGAWIFPDEPRKFCLTTGGKNVMASLESLVTKRVNHDRSLDSSELENMEKNVACIGTRAEASKHAEIDETEESKSKNSDGNGDEILGRPVKQVIKVAIIIGFGIFVLLTRQRK